tara:strand:+ start:1439 stop:1918 length:480 start_codon:yes stop_codon:yes gene_type:complete
MFLLFNKNSLIFPIFISFFLILLQGFLPTVILADGLVVTCDLFLIYLTWLALNKKLYQIIVFAFFIGMFQDLVIQPETVGLYSFIKVISVYFINYLKKVASLWNELIKLLYLFIVYFSHYFLYHYVFINEFTSIFLVYIFLESVFNLIIFIICDKIFFN